jgi:hypothetical protein
MCHKIRVFPEPFAHIVGRGIIRQRVAKDAARFANRLYGPTRYAHGLAECLGGADDFLFVAHAADCWVFKRSACFSHNSA